MKTLRVGGWLPHFTFILALLATVPPAPAQAEDEIRLTQIHLTVEHSADNGKTWTPARTNQLLRTGDRVRTGPKSRATILIPPHSAYPFPELTQVQILPPSGPSAAPGLHIFRGLLSIFHRGQPNRVQTVFPAGVAGVKGTEFLAIVDAQDRTSLYVIDGEILFTNAHGSLTLTNGQFALLEAHTAPAPAVRHVESDLNTWANNLLQWAFYYPAVLDPHDLQLTADETQALATSLSAYQSGDLPRALTSSGAHQPASDAEKIYRAALLLSVGKSDESSAELAQLARANTPERHRRLAAAIRQQIATTKREDFPAPPEPQLTTELLARSYYEQAQARGDESLERALNLARRAASNSPQFGFAWVRVAELEFSFGRTEKAIDALDKGLALSPRNAQAIALHGFLLAAQNKTTQAIEWFDRAIATDASLANAWLGRGLCRIRRGDLAGGREDLLLAAALEPRRAQLRSYLAKSFGDSGDQKRALHELELAKEMDPADPTAWLYSALIKAEQNRINEAIRDLEHAQDLNDNRSVHRSSTLLDQDRGVASANLARLYADAGLREWSVFEATRAVSYDYASYTAHYFLANSYESLRDPNLINLRYETPAQTEYLLANLLAPVGAGILSPTISQQEYSKLFERDRFGVVSATEYLSRGAWTQSGAQFGTFGNYSYSLEAFYRSDEGQRRNDDVEQRHLSLQLKHQLTPQDTLLFQVINDDAEGGDLAQYVDPSEAVAGYRFQEKQEPLVAIGYHREWSPGHHTLLLAARLEDTFSQRYPGQETFLKVTPSNSLVAVHGLRTHQIFRGEVEVYSTEVQQIWRVGKHNTVVGGRFQWGDFETRNLQTDPSRFAPQIPDPPADQDLSVDFHRTTVYGYHYWQVLPPLQLLAGINYDRITFPKNFRAAPISKEEETSDKISPKAGLIWTPHPDVTARLAYTRSLSGVSLDQSYRLEPSQVAGFIQSYRSIIPESVAGPNSAAEFETFGFSLEKKWRTGTYASVGGEVLGSEVRRNMGAFRYDAFQQIRAISQLREHLDYRERSLFVSVSQLVGDEWSLGARYRLAQARLTDVYPGTAGLEFSTLFTPRERTESLLHHVHLTAQYNHASGFFGQFEASWYGQDNDQDAGTISDECFWQFNAWVGYRFPRRHVVISAGVLNLADQDYRLNPLTTHIALPRDRTAVVRLLLSF